MDTLRERLISAREESGLSQTELGKKIGAGQSLISNLENGENQSSTKIPEIAHELGVDAYWLATGKGNRKGLQLTAEDKLILDAFHQFDRERQEEWLFVAARHVKTIPAKQTKAA